jgi:hypothetical protein
MLPDGRIQAPGGKPPPPDISWANFRSVFHGNLENLENPMFDLYGPWGAL